MNDEVSFETAETQLGGLSVAMEGNGGLSVAINETSQCVNSEKKGWEEVELEEVVMRTENVGSKAENLGDVVEEGEPPREVEGCVEERRSDLPVIDVTTPSQDGSSEHLL